MELSLDFSDRNRGQLDLVRLFVIKQLAYRSDVLYALKPILAKDKANCKTRRDIKATRPIVARLNGDFKIQSRKERTGFGEGFV
jgi:predicted permease